MRSRAAPKVAHDGNGYVYKPVLAEDLFTDQPAALRIPASNFGIDENSRHDRPATSSAWT